MKLCSTELITASRRIIAAAGVRTHALTRSERPRPSEPPRAELREKKLQQPEVKVEEEGACYVPACARRVSECACRGTDGGGGGGGGCRCFFAKEFPPFPFRR